MCVCVQYVYVVQKTEIGKTKRKTEGNREGSRSKIFSSRISNQLEIGKNQGTTRARLVKPSAT